ncbi:MAG: hypothetical protein IJY14_03590 [Acholeplasmatales bacterium]|nr:hypothetical protein [Acholeplasmatales bacterium]
MIELKKKTKIKRLNLDKNRRLIFVSDIHGDLETFKSGLEKINFNENDYLFIIGDIYEKGDFLKNLDTLNYVIELSKKDNVYPMAGNCDEVFRFILPEDAADLTLYYLLKKKNSVLNDIAYHENIEVNENMDIKAFIKLVYDKYYYLFEFMDSLDDVIIINDEIVLVHGGIDDIDNIPEYALPILKYDRFYELSRTQKKLMIVGHYPTRNYRADVSCVNPIFDFRKRIISIDGGNHIVKGGQINFVTLDSLSSMKFSFSFVDHYPKYTMKDDVFYQEPTSYVSIIFGDNEIEILDVDLDFYYIRHLQTEQEMWVHKSFVYWDEKTRKYYCYDASNQFISVHNGDVVSVVKKGKPYSVIKRNGYIGLIETRYLKNEVDLHD